MREKGEIIYVIVRQRELITFDQNPGALLILPENVIRVGVCV